MSWRGHIPNCIRKDAHMKMALIEGAESATSACPGEVAFQTAYENAFTGKSAESAAAVFSGEVTSQLFPFISINVLAQ